MISALPPDLSRAELRDFKLLGPEPTVRLELSDGSVLEIVVRVNGVLYVGQEPGTNFPIYTPNLNMNCRLVSHRPEMRRPPASKQQSSAGVA